MPPTIRCAFDIGSGMTKMVTAAVEGGRVETLHSHEEELLLRGDVARSTDNTISAGMLARLRAEIARLRDVALALGATQFTAAATAVFRTSANGAAFLDALSDELGMRIQVIAQELEAELGFLTAAALSADSPTLVAWDSGGGSFQLTTRAVVGGGYDTFLGSVGASTSTAWLMELQGQDRKTAVSANPASADQLKALARQIEESLPRAPARLGRPGPLVAIGSAASAFHVAAEAVGKSRGITLADLDAAIDKHTGWTDAQLRDAGFESQTGMVLPKLALLRCVMRNSVAEGCGFDYVAANGNCLGMLLLEKLWQ